MSYTGFLSEFDLCGIVDWLNILGSIVAFFLLGLKLKEFKQNQIRLDIDLKSSSFITKPKTSNKYGEWPNFTRLSFLAIITNKGRQPTTISRIELFSENPEINNLQIYNIDKSSSSETSFDPIRIKPNDIIEMDLFTVKKIYLKNYDSLICTLNFQTSHKTIKKSIKVNKQHR